MQKLCTAGLTGDGRGHHHHHTFAPVDLTAPKVAAGNDVVIQHVLQTVDLVGLVLALYFHEGEEGFKWAGSLSLLHWN